MKSHVFELTFGFLKDFNIRANYNYNVAPSYFVITRNADNTNMMNIHYINRTHAKSWSVNATYNKDICKFWTTSLYAGIWGEEYKYTDEKGIARNNNTPRWTVSTQNTFTLPGKVMWDLGFSYTGAGSSNAFYIDSYWNLYTTLRRDFFDGALSVRLTANDLFHSSSGWQRSVLPGGNRNFWNGNTRYVVLNVSYKFGKSKHEYKSMSGSEEEQNRL